MASFVRAQFAVFFSTVASALNEKKVLKLVQKIVPIFEQCLFSRLDSILVLQIPSLNYLLLDGANLPNVLA